MRLQTYFLNDVHLKVTGNKNACPKTPQKMMPFEWEKAEKEIVIPTPIKWDMLQKTYGK